MLGPHIIDLCIKEHALCYGALIGHKRDVGSLSYLSELAFAVGREGLS